MTIKAIETVYNGYRMRSRLEARWAVFFDRLGIKYKYEPEGFDLGDAGWYLPDFWLPHPRQPAETGWGFWVEIKPIPATEIEIEKVKLLVSGTKHNALIFQGNPWPGEYTVTKISGVHFENPRTWDNLTFQVTDWGYCSLVASAPYRLGSYPAFFPCSVGKLQQAYTAARQARFEHGETPRAA